MKQVPALLSLFILTTASVAAFAQAAPATPAAPGPSPSDAELPPADDASSRGDAGDGKGDRGALVVGAKVGALASLDGLSPHVTGALELGYILPWLGRAFAVGASVSYAQPTTSGVRSDPRVDAGSYTWHLTEQQLAIVPSVAYRATMLPEIGPGQFVPYASAGPRLVLAHSRTDSDGELPTLLPTEEESMEIGAGGALGTEYLFGPGAFLVEALFGWAPIAQQTTGEASLLGISAWGGYRLML